MKRHMKKGDDSSDSGLLDTIRMSSEASEAFLATSRWGHDRFKQSIRSRGDCFDRCGSVGFELNGETVLEIPVASLPATIGSSQQADFVLNTMVSRVCIVISRLWGTWCASAMIIPLMG